VPLSSLRKFAFIRVHSRLLIRPFPPTTHGASFLISCFAMPTIYQLKPAFQNLLRPVTRSLASAGITANQITLSAVALSFVVGGLLAWQPSARWALLLVPVTMFVRMALNAIDGMLAREHGMKSPLGAILNELGDVVADAALYLPFTYVVGLSPMLVVAVVILAIVSEMTGVVAVQIGATRRYDGPMGKSDRAFLFGLLALLAGSGVSLALWADYLLAAAGLLLCLTIFNRARNALKEVTRAKS
jgi:CDP-diacylglycerol---glycerol-3-phosphate 3-phosphatidyltransferase